MSAEDDKEAQRGRVGRFVSDLSGLPILRLQAPSQARFERVDVPSFFEGIDDALAHDRPFVVLLDARGLPPVDFEQRIEFVGMVNARRARLRSSVAGFAAVVASPFERGLITAFAWFSNPPLPVRLFAAADEASTWLLQRLTAFEGPDGSTSPAR